MHSSIRSGALVALESEPDAVKLAQGCWSSVASIRSYASRSIQHADHVTDMLHDLALCPITHSQLQFSVPTQPANTTVARPTVSPS